MQIPNVVWKGEEDQIYDGVDERPESPREALDAEEKKTLRVVRFRVVDGIWSTDRVVVFEIPSIPWVLRSVGSASCGPDQVDGAIGDAVALRRQSSGSGAGGRGDLPEHQPRRDLRRGCQELPR